MPLSALQQTPALGQHLSMPSPAAQQLPAQGLQSQALPTVSNQHVAANGTPSAGPRGDAYDSDEDSQASRGSGRGRHRTRRTRTVQSRHEDSDLDDPNDDYAINRENLERTHCKSLHVQEFNPNKGQDFDIWIKKFENAVNRGLNPHSRRRHFRYCLQWLPNYLGSDAFVVWSRSPHNKTDWEALKKELAKEYEDPILRSEWKGNLKAYIWDESKESLHTYSSKIKKFVDTFEDDLPDGSRAKLDAYFLRFKCGLPDDYQDQIKMSMPTSKQTIERALDVAQRYQSTQKGKTTQKSELSAAVTFEDPTMPARVQQNETEIIRLKNRVSKVEDKRPPSSSSYPGPKYTGTSPHRMSSHSRTSDFSSDSSHRSKDRMNRLNAWRKGGGHQSSHRRSGSQNRSYNQGRQGYNQHTSDSSHSSQHKKVSNPKSTSAPLEESRVSQTEAESGAEDQDETISEYAAYVEGLQNQQFLEFCARRDEGKVTIPGNL